VIITIDGPAASGKSTMARQFAEISGFVFMDSGLMYRAIAFGFLSHDVECTENSAKVYLPEMQLRVDCIESSMKIYVDSIDITSQLHTSQITEVSSRVAKIQSVRDTLLEVQRGFGEQFGNDPGIVAVGRDMGTIVFPCAPLKFFVTASLEVRARRRYDELVQTGSDVTFQEIYDAIAFRDQQDSQRKIAPLRKAPGSIEVNTDHLTHEGQLHLLLGYVKEQ